MKYFEGSTSHRFQNIFTNNLLKIKMDLIGSRLNFCIICYTTYCIQLMMYKHIIIYMFFDN
jgi:hypothetical protein